MSVDGVSSLQVRVLEAERKRQRKQAGEAFLLAVLLAWVFPAIVTGVMMFANRQEPSVLAQYGWLDPVAIWHLLAVEPSSAMVVYAILVPLSVYFHRQTRTNGSSEARAVREVSEYVSYLRLSRIVGVVAVALPLLGVVDRILTQSAARGDLTHWRSLVLVWLLAGICLLVVIDVGSDPGLRLRADTALFDRWQQRERIRRAGWVELWGELPGDKPAFPWSLTLLVGLYVTVPPTVTFAMFKWSDLPGGVGTSIVVGWISGMTIVAMLTLHASATRESLIAPLSGRVTRYIVHFVLVFYALALVLTTGVAVGWLGVGVAVLSAVPAAGLYLRPTRRIWQWSWWNPLSLLQLRIAQRAEHVRRVRTDARFVSRREEFAQERSALVPGSRSTFGRANARRAPKVDLLATRVGRTRLRGRNVAHRS